MSRLQGLKGFINQRLAAAVEDICGHFERTITEYEEEMERRLLHVVSAAQRKLRAEAGFPSEEEVPPEQQDWSSSLDQEDTEPPHIKEDQEDPEPPHIKEDQEDPEPPHIKEEQEELWTSQEGEQLQGLEEAEITKFTFTPVPVKSKDDEEEPQSSQLHQRLTEHMETEADGEDCGGPQPDRKSDPQPDRKSDPHKHQEPETETSDSSESEPEEDWTDPERKLFRCSVCAKTFKQKGNLNIHMRTHTGVKPFRCSVCSKRFTQKAGLDYHLKIHTGEKPFSCSVCNKSFRVNRTLQKHMMSHTGEKPFHCSICDESFSQNGHVQTHMRSMRSHTREKPFRCTVCRDLLQRMVLYRDA